MSGCFILLEDTGIEEKTIFKWILTEIHSEMDSSGSGEEPVSFSFQYGHSRQLILQYHKRRDISWEGESPSRWKENMQLDLYRNTLWNGFIRISEEGRGTSDEFLWKRQLILQYQKRRDISWEAESQRTVLHWVLYKYAYPSAGNKTSEMFTLHTFHTPAYIWSVHTSVVFPGIRPGCFLDNPLNIPFHTVCHRYFMLQKYREHFQ